MILFYTEGLSVYMCMHIYFHVSQACAADSESTGFINSAGKERKKGAGGESLKICEFIVLRSSFKAEVA